MRNAGSGPCGCSAPQRPVHLVAQPVLAVSLVGASAPDGSPPRSEHQELVAAHAEQRHDVAQGPGLHLSQREQGARHQRDRIGPRPASGGGEPRAAPRSR